MLLSHPHTDVVKIIAFLKDTFAKQGKQHAVIAVSGGIDSALSLTLVSRALPAANIFPILLPNGDQSIEDSKLICAFNKIPEKNVSVVNIQKTVQQILETRSDVVLKEKGEDDVAKGNIMARVRMIYVYDLAKKMNALVCGTENKSEKHLAYFTRFGDEASDIEPIEHLYKTQVRQLAEHLQMPEVFVRKSPSAGLWLGQTDEEELGFTYEQADQVMEQYIDEKKAIESIQIESTSNQDIVRKVVARIQSQQFKHEVPYHL